MHCCSAEGAQVVYCTLYGRGSASPSVALVRECGTCDACWLGW